MVSTKKPKPASPDTKAPNQEQIDAALCERVLQSADPRTRAVWLRVGILHGFDPALARFAASLANVDDDERDTALRRCQDLPFVEPNGAQHWYVHRGARRHCAKALLEEVGEEACMEVHLRLGEYLLSRDGDTDEWARTQRLMCAGHHLLPADPARGLAVMFQAEQEAAAQGRSGAVEMAAAVCEAQRHWLDDSHAEPPYFVGLWRLRSDAPDKARAVLSLALARAEENVPLLLAVLPALAEALAKQHDLAGAAACLERARAIAERQARPDLACAITLALGRMYDTGGMTEHAEQALAQALGLARALRDTEAEALVLVAVGDAAVHAARYDPAEKTYRKARRILRDAGDRRGEMQVALSLGECYLASGRLNEAVTMLMAALDLGEPEGNERLISGGLQALAKTYRQQGRPGLFLAVSEKQSLLEQQRHNRHGYFFAQCHVGDACFDLGDWPGAQTAYRRAVELSDRDGAVTRHCKQRLKDLEDRLRGPRRGEPRLADLVGLLAPKDAPPPHPRGGKTRELLAQARLVAVDGAFWRALLTGEGPLAEPAVALARLADQRRVRIVTAASAVGEVLDWLRREGLAKPTERVEQLLVNGRRVIVTPIDADLAARVARVRTTHPTLDMASLSQMMAAQLARVDLFLTGDDTLAEMSRAPAAGPSRL